MSSGKLLCLLTIVLLLSASILSACQPTVSSTPVVVEVTRMVTGVPVVEQVVITPTAEPKPTEVPKPTERPKPSGKIVVWGWSYDPLIQAGLMDEFKAEYPDIEVQFETLQWDVEYQKLDLALSAGEGAPDVAQVENYQLAHYVLLGGLSDLTEQVQPYIDQMLAYKWSESMKDGHYYAFPWDAAPVMLFYRRDVLEKAGLPTEPEEVAPLFATWDDYLTTCKTIKEKTGLNCFSNSKANNTALIYEMMLWQQGLGYYDESGKVSVDSPENVATLEKMGEFWTANVTSDEAPWTDGWYTELGSLDKPVATIVDASWMGWFIKAQIASGTFGKWGIVKMPVMKAGQIPTANDGGSTLIIPEQSKNKDAAWAFIEFMWGRKDSQLKQLAITDFLPALKSTFDSPLILEPDPFYKGEFTRKLFVELALQIPIARIYGPYYPVMNRNVSTAIQQYATGQMSAADALKEAAATIRSSTGLP